MSIHDINESISVKPSINYPAQNEVTKNIVITITLISQPSKI